MIITGHHLSITYRPRLHKMDPRRVGVLGGGQLGRMMAEAGHRLGIQLAILDPGKYNVGSGDPSYCINDHYCSCL